MPTLDTVTPAFVLHVTFHKSVPFGPSSHYLAPRQIPYRRHSSFWTRLEATHPTIPVRLPVALTLHHRLGFLRRWLDDVGFQRVEQVLLVVVVLDCSTHG